MENVKLAQSMGLPTGDLFHVLTSLRCRGFVWVFRRRWPDHLRQRALERLLRTFHGAVVRVWLAEGDSSRRHPGARRSVEIGPPVRCEVLRGPGPLPAPFGNPSLGTRSPCAGPPVSGDFWVGCGVDIDDMVQANRKDARQFAHAGGGGERGRSGYRPRHAVRICRVPTARHKMRHPACRRSLRYLQRRRLARPPGLLYRRLAWQGIWSRHRLLRHGRLLRRRMSVVSSIATHPSLGRDCATSFFPMAVKACWSRPIQGVDGKVLATFGFYFDEERAPNAEEMSRMDGITTHRDHVDRTHPHARSAARERGALSAYGRAPIPRFRGLPIATGASCRCRRSGTSRPA